MSRGAAGAGTPLNVPPVLASNFALGSLRAYSRDDATPTWEAFEELLGGLEGGETVAFASGMGAIAAVFDLLPVGATVALPDDCYQGVAGLADAGEAQGRWRVVRVGVDDTHAGWGDSDAFGAWTWLKMDSATPENVVRAVAAGACYASCGPEVHDFRLADGQVRLRCSPVAKIQFLGGPSVGATQRAEPGGAVTAFAIDLPPWPFVRALITDAAGRRAWTNPIVLPEPAEEEDAIVD